MKTFLSAATAQMWRQRPGGGGGGALIYVLDRGAQVTLLGLKFERKLLFWVSQLYNYFFGFMKS